MNYETALKVLGLTTGFTEDELKKAYRSSAKKSHPDVNNGSDNLFLLVKESYDFLLQNGSNQRQSLFNREQGRGIFHGETIFTYMIRR